MEAPVLILGYYVLVHYYTAFTLLTRILSHVVLLGDLQGKLKEMQPDWQVHIRQRRTLSAAPIFLRTPAMLPTGP
jgi:hypothetical protein